MAWSVIDELYHRIAGFRGDAANLGFAFCIFLHRTYDDPKLMPCIAPEQRHESRAEMLPVVVVRAEEHGNGWGRQVAAPFASLFLFRVLEYGEELAQVS
jgi:hypothetical protein